MQELNRFEGVLVVEDEFLTAHHVEEILWELGFREVHLAHNLAAAKELLRARTVGLAILDVNLGSELVFPLAAELHARHIPIIFATAYSRLDFPSEWATHPIVPKPVTGDALKGAIGTLEA